MTAGVVDAGRRLPVSMRHAVVCDRRRENFSCGAAYGCSGISYAARGAHCPLEPMQRPIRGRAHTSKKSRP